MEVVNRPLRLFKTVAIQTDGLVDLIGPLSLRLTCFGKPSQFCCMATSPDISVVSMPFYPCTTDTHASPQNTKLQKH